ncbi:putative toxin-antitoxin system toxin component, PIN family [Patescibacteria group bacterium AH-259-L07]|nr:putative toxin-antitoxin system toxin component, PIN family [Patescibacteria group bacterium AH-259-L07]
MKVILDTNIYISAILFDRECEKVIRLLKEHGSEILISDFILKEIEFVLRKKFHWSEQEIRLTLYDIETKTTVIDTHSNIHIIKQKMSDNKILECAVDGKADLIISGDTKHIQPLKKFKGIPIVSPGEFIKAVNS